MKRKILGKMLDWKNEWAGRTALLIEGMRRVGKSYSVEEFAKAEYKSYILIDFQQAPNEVKDLFNDYLDDLDSLFLYLSTYYNTELHEISSLKKFTCKYKEQTFVPYVLQPGALKEEDGIVFLPLYMTPLLGQE